MPGAVSDNPAYQAAGHFRERLDMGRYLRQSQGFDGRMEEAQERSWDPHDPLYLDYSQPFDLSRESILPPERFPELTCPLGERLAGNERVRLANELCRWHLSNILHLEEGALALSASLCETFRDPLAQQYAANQAREEARHVAAFGRYIARRWGTPYPAGPVLGDFLAEIVATPLLYRKLLGMHVLVEGLAMGAFADLHAHARDPLLRRILLFVTVEEAGHHEFGKIWAEETLPKLSMGERERVEDWTAWVFETLLLNLGSVTERASIYESIGMDWRELRESECESFKGGRRLALPGRANLFGMLARTALNAGIVTKRTRYVYAAWLDPSARNEEDERVAGEVAAEGLDRLRAINRRRVSIGQKLL
jgi:hypothetical protein